jgi:hypothetical protein
VGYNSISLLHLSLEYVSVPVSATTLSGAAYNPTGDTVQMAFMPQATQVPQSSDWQAAVWSTVAANVLFPYSASCLVGPGGTITLGIGTYVMYVKIGDYPEVPVEQVPMQLEIF